MSNTTKIVLAALGVAVVGGGVYALTRKPSGQLPGPQPGPGPLPPGPTPGPPSGSKLAYAQNDNVIPPIIHFRQNQYYRGRMEIQGANLLPFNLEADDQTILKGLSALGIANGKIYMQMSDLPSDWPPETVLGAGPNTRWFEGQWTLLTGDVPKPPTIVSVWATLSPAGVAAAAAKMSGAGCG
jgi:hypothetical protein